ncbi:hypothetical protein, partial [Paenibacillus elgii]|uniref:hypothetical protein n=1 Tax=Paenibacillus elgii TaxID=189691 RepID=UPI0030D83FAB
FIALFSGDLINISHLPIRLQVLFFYQVMQERKKALALRGAKTNVTYNRIKSQDLIQKYFISE